jgi:hypothetical protein
MSFVFLYRIMYFKIRKFLRMTAFNNRIEEFFKNYEKRTNNALQGMVDTEETAGAFADCFVEASPGGIMCGRNDKEFRKAIPEGYGYYRNIGTRSMDITSLEVSELNDIHYMAKVSWKATYIKKDNSKEVIEFDVIYFLQEREEELKIFAFITGDEQKALKDRGII